MECHLGKITVNYEAFGEGRPIVIIHGKEEDHRCMVAGLEPIFNHRSGWKRLYPDLPGHGKTRGLDWITGNDEMLRVTLDFIDNVTRGERFVLAGESYCGYLARGVVHGRGSLIDGLFLWVPVITYGKRNLPSHATLVEDSTFTSQLTEREKDFLRGNFLVVQSQRALDYLRAYALPSYTDADHKFIMSKTINNFSFDRDGFTEHLDKPTLIVCGRQDSVVGYSDQWRILENYPRATFAVLDRAGHFLGGPGEQEELFNLLVNDWLDRVEEAANKDLIRNGE